ncbi:MAG: hypothetical protein MN733_07275 [Nitrososphaera sp.]|nr:hypothetical protein [Nitrososphaera sp.]
MKLYIASSWKNEPQCIALANALSSRGHQVDCFCDPRRSSYSFHWRELFEEGKRRGMKYDAISFLSDSRVQRAFLNDKRWLDWSEGVVLLVPSGRSAHLEAGYAVGQGKHLWVHGSFPKGEFDVMYGFAHKLFHLHESEQLFQAIANAESQRRN